ncbi:hypothetical protein PUN28_010536 [Cardiocondyla obscurior]|uniref:Uncharacterized protein n=1 Tax=Cardiocondyla obscurior TaxID=286306 RepID=A0AAW2FKY8_9HYME
MCLHLDIYANINGETIHFVRTIARRRVDELPYNAKIYSGEVIVVVWRALYCCELHLLIDTGHK